MMVNKAKVFKSKFCLENNKGTKRINMMSFQESLLKKFKRKA